MCHSVGKTARQTWAWVPKAQIPLFASPEGSELLEVLPQDTTKNISGDYDSSHQARNVSLLNVTRST
jgi:hypothetical protein